MSGPELETRLAQVAWTAYREAVGPKSFDGTLLPSWDELINDPDPRRKLIVQAWKMTGLAVANEIADVVANGKLQR